MANDGHRSIGERMRRAKSAEVKLLVAQEWATSWYKEQSLLLRKLKTAVNENDKTEQNFYLRQLEAVNKKRHEALYRVFERLAKDDNGSNI